MFEAVVFLAAAIFISVGLRFLIIGERFDRALHRVDPGYRNFRDMGREFLSEPIGALRRLPRMYGRYADHYARPLEHPAVERLRGRARRAALDIGTLGFGGVIGTFVVGSLLRGISPTLHDGALIALQVALAAYWVLKLWIHVREPSWSRMILVYMVVGVGTAIGAVLATVSTLIGG